MNDFDDKIQDAGGLTLCNECGEGSMEVEYWWKVAGTNKEKGNPTGDLICDSCGHRKESSKII